MKAIVTGASGFIGSQLVAELLKGGYQVAALGRTPVEDLPLFRRQLLSGSQYFQFDLDAASNLSDELQRAGFFGRELNYFFHFAWGGENQLSDLDIVGQSANIHRTVITYQISKQLHADRYIFCGTMEEAFAEAYTKLDYNTADKFNRHVVYALAKLDARYALKIEYMCSPGPGLIFATNSHVIGPGDEKDSFLQVALQKIINSEDIYMSSGKQLFDVIDVEDCATAYIAIAEKGKVGASYWVGSGNPRPLREYVEEMNSIYPSVKIHYGSAAHNDVTLDEATFSITNLIADTEYSPKLGFCESVRKLERYLNRSL